MLEREGQQYCFVSRILYIYPIVCTYSSLKMNSREQKHVTESMSQLQIKGDTFTRAVVLERRRLDELEQALAQASEEIKKYRIKTKMKAVDVLNMHKQTARDAYSRADGHDPTKQAELNQKRLVANMEARLNKMLVRHSEIVKGDEQLREAISHMRKSRMTTDDVHHQYEVEMMECRKRITGCMELAAKLNEERENLVRQKEDIVEANAEEEAAHQRRQDEVAGFVQAQNAALEASIADAARQSTRVGNFETVPNAGNLTVEEEEEIRKQLLAMDAADAKERENLKVVENRAIYYASAFEDLKRVSGIDDLDRLVKVFMRQEEDNFSLFNYIQAVSQEVDQGIDKAKEIEKDIALYKEEQGVEEGKRVEQIKKLENGVAAQAWAKEEWAAKVSKGTTVTEVVAKKVQSIFFKTQCDHYLQTALKDASANGMKMDLTGLESATSMMSGQGVGESNILAYMSLIEKRAVQVVKAYERYVTLTSGLPLTLSGPPRPSSWEEGGVIQHAPDLSEDDSDIGDAAEQPVPIADARREMEEKMSRKAVQAAKKKATYKKRASHANQPHAGHTITHSNTRVK